MITAEIKADSVAPHGKRITTLLLNMPKFILAQFNKHRMFSSSAESSRAIPTTKLIERAKTSPVIPLKWCRNVRGMSGGPELSPAAQAHGLRVHLSARDSAVFHAESMLNLAEEGQEDEALAKESVNRYLEPYLYWRVLVTATEWDNFFRLRLHHKAQPEMQRLAQVMKEAMNASSPASVGYGEWHMPFGERMPVGELTPGKAMISAARCARLSYAAHDGEFSPARDKELAARLLSDGHLGPFEHAAYPMPASVVSANLVGWKSNRTFMGY